MFPHCDILLLTINLWALFRISPERETRIEAFIHYIKALPQPYSIIAIQELWGKEDYLKIKKALEAQYPHSYYAPKSRGSLGAGLAVFTSFKILDSKIHPYSMNGKPEYIHHGDWYTTKSIICLKLEYSNAHTIYFYNTHLIANYEIHPGEDSGPRIDLYVGHRYCQAYEMLKFIHDTYQSGHILLIASDLNSEPTSSLYKSLLLSGLRDAWYEGHKKTLESLPITKNKMNGATYGIPGNYWTSRETPKRIDYIFYLKNSIRLVFADVTMNEPMTKDDSNKFISDHIGVQAGFIIAMDQHEGSKEKLIIDAKHDKIWLECRNACYTDISLRLAILIISFTIFFLIWYNGNGTLFRIMNSLNYFYILHYMAILYILYQALVLYYLFQEMKSFQALIDLTCGRD